MTYNYSYIFLIAFDRGLRPQSELDGPQSLVLGCDWPKLEGGQKSPQRIVLTESNSNSNLLFEVITVWRTVMA